MRYILFDRSRHEDFEKCPRLRLIRFEYPIPVEAGDYVYGVQKQAIAVPLLTGGVTHKGLEAFATGQQENESVQIALDNYDTDITERGIELEITDKESPESFWTIKVQRLLCEALIRGWVRCTWPKINSEYIIIDAEKEERLEIPLDEETIAVLLTRSDLIVQRRNDGRHFVFNHKTINEPTDKKLQSLRYDTQSISEVLAAQARYDAINISAEPGHARQIDGVIYDLLIKGPRKVEYPKGSGVWHSASPLIWCYVKEGQTGISEDELAAKWEWTCTAPHPAYRGVCPGNAKHTLGPKYHRKLISEVFKKSPVLEWFQWLEEHEPGLVEQQFITQPAIMRSPYDVEVWKRSVLTEEWGIADRAEIARQHILEKGFAGAVPELDGLFPKHTAHGNCFWPGKCTAFDVCWGAPADDLLQIESNSGEPLYAPRKSNHPEIVDVGE